MGEINKTHTSRSPKRETCTKTCSKPLIANLEMLKVSSFKVTTNRTGILNHEIRLVLTRNIQRIWYNTDRNRIFNVIQWYCLFNGYYALRNIATSYITYNTLFRKSAQVTVIQTTLMELWLSSTKRWQSLNK